MMEFLVFFHRDSLKKMKLVRTKLKEKEREKEKLDDANKLATPATVQTSTSWMGDKAQRDLDESQLFELHDPIEVAFSLATTNVLPNQNSTTFHED
jgi:hypothetical protein